MLSDFPLSRTDYTLVFFGRLSVKAIRLKMIHKHTAIFLYEHVSFISKTPCHGAQSKLPVPMIQG